MATAELLVDHLRGRRVLSAGLTRRDTGIATPDALIAATALMHGIPLMTRNRRHFDRVAGLRVVTPT